MPEYVNYRARVRKWNTIQAAGRTYTVPSRLVGKEVQIRLYAEHLEVYYKGHLVERMERVRGEREARVDYRHIIGSLVCKPGAFARYRFREQMFPSMTFRLAYDALKRWRGERADVEYVRILHLAATTMESTVDSALALLLEAGDPFDYAAVKDLANPTPPLAPLLNLAGLPDLRVYDSLLAGWPDDRHCGNKRPDRRAVPSIPAAHHGRAVGGPVHCRRTRRCSIHFPGSAGAGGRGPEAAAHRQAAYFIEATGGQDLGDPRFHGGRLFEHDRVPLSLQQQLGELADGNFVERGVNVLAFGLPGTGKTHALCAVGHRLVESGRSVLFAPAYRLVQSLPRRRPGTSLPPSGTYRCSDNYTRWTTTTSCCSMTWDTSPREPRSRRCFSR